MASTPFLLAAFVSLIAIVSAADYGYSPEPVSSDKVDNGYSPTPKPDIAKPDNGYAPRPKLLEPIKPESGYKPKLNLGKIPKPDYGYGPKPELPNGPKPNLDHLKPEKPLPISIEGLVLCKSGSNYVRIEGAVVRITCSVMDQNGYETTPISCVTDKTDAKGYFFKTLSGLGVDDDKLKLSECKAYLESSPLESCKVPTDVNKGISGALLSTFRLLEDNKLKLYTVGPFFFTPQPQSTPIGY